MTRRRIAGLFGTLSAAVMVLAGCGPFNAALPPTPVPTQAPSMPAGQYANEADLFLTRFTAAGMFSGAVLVAREGDVLFSKGYGFADRNRGVPNTRDTRFRLAAITSQFTALAILLLQSKGLVDVQHSICAYLPTCPSHWDPITIHHLLSRTSGLPDYVYPLYSARALATPHPPEDIIALIGDQPTRYPPGDEVDFWMSFSEYFLLAQIVEQVSGVPYHDYLKQTIFDPLGMNHTVPVSDEVNLALEYTNDSLALALSVDPSILKGAGSLSSTVDDLHRWDRSFTTEQLLPQGGLDQMFMDYGSFSWEDVSAAEHRGLSGSAYAWYLGEHFGRRNYQYLGWFPGGVDHIVRYPDDGVTIILLGNQGSIESSVVVTKLGRILFGEED